MLLCLFACLAKTKKWGIILHDENFSYFSFIFVLPFTVFIIQCNTLEKRNWSHGNFHIKLKCYFHFCFVPDVMFVTHCMLITCKIKNMCLLMIFYCLYPHSIHFPRFQFYYSTKQKVEYTFFISLYQKVHPPFCKKSIHLFS